jgi:hypothetical protein
VVLSIITNEHIAMDLHLNNQVETLFEGLLLLQVRLNNLTIRLYKSVGLEEKLYTAQHTDEKAVIDKDVVLAR